MPWLRIPEESLLCLSVQFFVCFVLDQPHLTDLTECLVIFLFSSDISERESKAFVNDADIRRSRMNAHGGAPQHARRYIHSPAAQTHNLLWVLKLSHVTLGIQRTGMDSVWLGTSWNGFLFAPFLEGQCCPICSA